MNKWIGTLRWCNDFGTDYLALWVSNYWVLRTHAGLGKLEELKWLKHNKTLETLAFWNIFCIYEILSTFVNNYVKLSKFFHVSIESTDSKEYNIFLELSVPRSTCYEDRRGSRQRRNENSLIRHPFVKWIYLKMNHNLIQSSFKDLRLKKCC